MQIEETNNHIVLHGVTEFDLEQTFSCGQCFRWERDSDGTYTGLYGAHPLRIGQQGDVITLYHTTKEEYETIWRGYFDLNTDYRTIQVHLARDAVMRRAISAGRGIRLLVQEPFETLISFIISANNNIPRIKGIIARALRGLPARRFSLRAGRFTPFPPPKRLHGSRAQTLRRCGQASATNTSSTRRKK